MSLASPWLGGRVKSSSHRTPICAPNRSLYMTSATTITSQSGKGSLENKSNRWVEIRSDILA
eukprot:scaffold121961_cov52-Attheya_sp.AAC.2